MLDYGKLDPQMGRLLEALESAPPLWSLPPAEARAAMAAFYDAIEPEPPLDRVEALDADLGGRTIAATLFAPADPRGVIVYFHGGGWVIGGIRQAENACRTLAVQSGCAVLSFAYRLAPEHPFPAAIDDATDALGWTAAHAGRLFGKPLPLIVAGDSAGGNLATVAAGIALDRGGPELAALLLVYPVLDADFETESYRVFADMPGLNRQMMQWFFDCYAPDPAMRTDPTISPIRRQRLAGMPPVIAISAGHDPLSSECENYLARLSDAGVPVAHRHYPELVHGFIDLPTLVDAARDALGWMAGQLSVRLDEPEAA